MNAPVILNLVPNTPEWHTHRASHFNASDAPAMLGISPYVSRTALLDRYSSGVPEEIDAATQVRFDRGHEYEAMARPWAEDIIGEELYPCVMSREIDGLKLSASMDGLTMAGDIAWEHKTLNAEIAATINNGELLDYHRAQMEHQLIVSGAEKCLFMASNGNPETALTGWYESDPDIMRERIISGWKQFAADLANHQPTKAKPETVANPIQSLPALLVEIEGRVVSTNLDRFQAAAKALIGSIKTNLSTDQDFADAEATVKFCKDAESKLETVKAQALAQTASIDEVFRVMDGLKEELRAKRLSLEKSVKIRKDEVRAELIAEAYNDVSSYASGLNQSLGSIWITPPPKPVIGDVIKGKKTVTSCRDALSAKRAEIIGDMTRQAERFTRNRESIKRDSRDWYPLFPDFSAVGNREAEEFDALAELRIRKALEAEAERARLERERIERETEARIRAEEAAKAKAEADKAMQEQIAIERQKAQEEARIRAEEAAKVIAKPEPAKRDSPAPESKPTQVWANEIEAFIAANRFRDVEYARLVLIGFANFMEGK